MKRDTVLFDLDQTLLDKKQSLYNFSRYQFNKFSLSRFISREQDFIEKFVALNMIVLPKDQVYKQLVASFDIEEDLLPMLLKDLNQNFHLHCVGYEGLHSMLEVLKSKHFKLGVVTNGRDFYQRNKIASLGIDQYFDTIVTSGSVNIRKPDHAIFKLALKALNTLSEKAVFVGDNLEADIIPAKALGMSTVHMGGHNAHPCVDVTCANLNDIPRIIESFG
ncbi:putative hydrolase of the HAD superfamily [Pullulanibacillus pueri]|uniref:2-haloalkanoic acid dehalogenase n=1 Tax=Pullulanibacillus pueri TaxID=1437324 RepID=A0A8J2ZTI6_9BACL|nr:HAD-IA family hydrolase [Pullulanibacillus pueri]MBM7681144.1 putative hydrolase of the HAD superfamily [Pullulanibacillus pueri]GGH77217.1 2-haloalkanoic acid dehalogenase [Pullulanibacillus pueri]